MISTSHVDLESVFLHYGSAGVRGKTPVLFLHGWPDLWFTWEEQMLGLAEQGYFSLAPDQRGYGRSSKPPRVSDYQMPVLTRDIVQFIERLQTGPVHLVGHDWGGAVAWSLALTRPDLVRTLTAVNSPHPAVFAKNLLTHPGQLLRSWYMFLFQVPGLAETLLGSHRAKLQTLMIEHGAKLRDPDLLARYREQWQNPGAVRLPLYWYRALFRSLFSRDSMVLRQKVKVPTQIVWGTDDGAFVPDSGKASAAWCEHAELHELSGGHWPFHEHPERFQALMRDWLARHDTPVSAAPTDARRTSLPEVS
jgi:pimeloyl-ACP methyl ester carboxylesterase